MLPSFPKPRPAVASLDSIRQVITAHFVEMPGLSLTTAQVRRLCCSQTTEVEACQACLEALVAAHFLTRSRDGQYRRVA